MGFKDWIKKKWEEYKKEREEKKLLKRIYETRKKALLVKERRKAAHELAERHARLEAKREVEGFLGVKYAKRGRPVGLNIDFGKVSSEMAKLPIVQDPFGFGVSKSRKTKRKKKRKPRRQRSILEPIDFADYL